MKRSDIYLMAAYEIAGEIKLEGVSKIVAENFLITTVNCQQYKTKNLKICNRSHRVKFKHKPIRPTDFSVEIIQARRVWNNVLFHVPKENNCSIKITILCRIYPSG